MKKRNKPQSASSFDRLGDPRVRELTQKEQKQVVGGGGSGPQPDVFGRTL
jgi:hypothetical protein